jgi:hypothetical protein
MYLLEIFFAIAIAGLIWFIFFKPVIEIFPDLKKIAVNFGDLLLKKRPGNTSGSY